MNNISFHQIVFRREWEFRNPNTGFYYRSGVIPDRLFYSELSGRVTEEEAISAMPVLIAAYESGFMDNADFSRVVDYSGVTKADINARKAYARTLNEHNLLHNYKPKITYICGASYTIQIALRLFSIFLRQRFIFVRSVEDAFHLMNHNSKENDRPAKASMVSIRDMDEINALAGGVLMGDDEELSQITVSPDNPLRDLAEMLKMVKSDLDESSRKEHDALEKFKKSEYKFREIINQSNDMMIMMEAENGEIVDMNRQTALSLDADYKDLLGKNALNFYKEHPDYPEFQWKDWNDYVSELREKKHMRIYGILTRRDGSEFPVETSMNYLTLHGQNYVVALARDITSRVHFEAELIKARDEAERANQAKSIFLANISHELRTPLNGILGFAQLLELDDNLNDAQRKDIGTIRRSGEHLLNLINEILDLAKIESGKMDLEIEPVNLRHIVDEMIQIVKVRADVRGLDLQWHCEGLPEWIQADGKRLRQILLNLLGNAVKFTEEGRIEFLISSSERFHSNSHVHLHFLVIDSGPGIPGDKLKYVLQPFEQLNMGNEHNEGTGLGLSISRTLVDRMGGELHLGSKTHDGKWTTTASESSPVCVLTHGTVVWFSLIFPMPENLDPGEVEEESSRVVGFHGRVPDILIVDDLGDSRLLMKKILRRRGMRVRETDNGERALIMAKEKKPDLLITDLYMPGMDGYDLIYQIRNDEYLKDVKIIASSANVVVRAQLESAHRGSDAFLPKPVQVQELYRIVCDLLEIEWIYDEIESDQAETRNRDLGRPDGNILRQLREFADAGNMDGVIGVCDGIKDDHAIFVSHIMSFIEHFRLKELSLFLQE